MSHGKVSRKTTLWVGSDDGEEGGWEGGGFDVDSEDHMVAITGQLDETEETVEIFILRDLFPKIRSVMDRIDRRFETQQRDERAVMDRLSEK